MTYSTTTSFNSATGVLSGTLAWTNPAPNALPPPPASPISDVVISGYADGANSISYFAQTRTDSSGNWSLPTVRLSPGTHSISITADYSAAPIGSTSITTTIGGTPLSEARRDHLVNNVSRS